MTRSENINTCSKDYPVEACPKIPGQWKFPSIMFVGGRDAPRNTPIRTHKPEMNRDNGYNLPAIYNNILQLHPQGVGGVHVLKAWRHHPWRRPLMAKSLGRSTISSLSYSKISWLNTLVHTFSYEHEYTDQGTYLEVLRMKTAFSMLRSLRPVLSSSAGGLNSEVTLYPIFHL